MCNVTCQAPGSLGKILIIQQRNYVNKKSRVLSGNQGTLAVTSKAKNPAQKKKEEKKSKTATQFIRGLQPVDWGPVVGHGSHGVGPNQKKNKSCKIDISLHGILF